MRITRKFTQAGQDVFDSIEWRKRSSRISNLDGSVVFEMNDAEVPASWSQLATDIMVSKYFRKAGVPQFDQEGNELKDEQGRVVTGPERSARQVIHRLAGCWRHWGETHGYFDTAEDAQAFYDELCYMMLTQMAAPNSPQWFNTGLHWAYGLTGPAQGHWVTDPATGETHLADDAYSHPQPHACFIQSIEDDLVNENGIMDLWVREARLFKYGSGTGTNFSRLRGENEPLSGGGKSSGLMSWLKIGDRAAGAIKSGGTTRRAAKMVCLDLDHPDIEKFVNWKVREELKVAALVAGLKVLPRELRESAERMGLTLDYDFNGEAYATVSGQNSNNSIRMTSDFFRALQGGEDWHLYRRTDGELAKTLPASALWDQIAYAAWRCADPGVQYDTTINQWHTCPASGRINASNPCVTGDTLVSTSTGYRRIADLVGKSAEIIGGDGRPVFVDRIFRTGHKPVYELKTRSGYRLRLTGDHRVMTLNRGDVPACELTCDDQVQLQAVGFGDDFVAPAFGELLGAAVGDGCITHQPEQDFLFIALGHEESAVAEQLAGNIQAAKQWLDVADGRQMRPSTVTQTASGLRVGSSVQVLLDRMQQYAILDQGSHAKRLTDAVYGLDKASQAAILRGLFTSDGTVANYGSKSQYIALDSTSLELLQQVQLLLLGFGIKAKLYENRRALGQDTALLPDGQGGTRAYAIRQVHSLRISRASRIAFAEQIGFLPSSAKSRQLAELNQRVAAYRDPLADRVESLTACGSEDVFDLTEPQTHHFVANGMVVHNCSEYMFLDNTACNLASLNLLKFFDAKARRFDVDAFEHATNIWTVVLEISVLMAAFPSREIAQLSYRYRTLGLGYANLGAMLMQAGIPYDSEQGRALAGAITAILTGRSYASSADMAREHGPFPGYEDNKPHMLRVIRNHRRAAYGVPRAAEAASAHEMGDYEELDIRPVPIDARWLTEETPGDGGVANSHELLDRARAAWDDALWAGEHYGYRNAQTTVIAPTGTIGLLMDCDTTGVEPDFALVKFKKLAGGGYFKIANQSLRPALVSLGYSPEQVRDILTFVMGRLSLDVPLPDRQGELQEDAELLSDWLMSSGLKAEELAAVTEALPTVFEVSHAFTTYSVGAEAIERLGLTDQAASPTFNLLMAMGLSRRQIDTLNRVICGTQTVEGAPHLRDEHLPVFDCANTCGPTGKRFIAPAGHIRMMAAAQPFISGAISKTINLPNNASIDDIKSAYLLSWELGLKANALYRDGCKLSQVLSNKVDTDEAIDAIEEDEDAVEAGKEEVAQEVAALASRLSDAPASPAERVIERIVERPLRRRLPDTRSSITHKFNVAGHEGYLTVGLHDDDTPGELFITMAKEGSTIGGLMDSLGTAISVALQYGVPVESLVTKFTHQRFEPAGMTHNRDIPFAKSLVDYIFRWLGMEFLPGYREANAPHRGTSGSSGDNGSSTARSSATASQAPAAAARPATHAGLARIRQEDATPARATTPRPASDRLNADRATAPAAEATGLGAALKDMQSDAPACENCGTITVRNGSCYKCLNCGSSLGCS